MKKKSDSYLKKRRFINLMCCVAIKWKENLILNILLQSQYPEIQNICAYTKQRVDKIQNIQSINNSRVHLGYGKAIENPIYSLESGWKNLTFRSGVFIFYRSSFQSAFMREESFFRAPWR